MPQITSDVVAALPASPKAKQWFIATDTKEVYICFVDGTWVKMAVEIP